MGMAFAAKAAAQARETNLPPEVVEDIMRMVQRGSLFDEVKHGTGIDLTRFGEQRSREELLSSHNEAVQKVKT